MKTKTEKISIIEICIVCIIGVLLLLIPGVFLGVFSSGLHLVDDHEILGYYYEYSKGISISKLIRYVVLSDIGIRFRPLYMLVKALLIPIFGDNLLKYEVLKAIESVISFVFIYLCIRKLRPFCASRFISLIFDCIVFVGYQSCIWWKLGTHEIQGALFFSIGFFLLLLYLETNKKKYIVGSLLLFELMIFVKENLFLLIPFIGLYIFYLDTLDEKLNILSIWKAIRRRIIIYLILVLIIIESLYGCLFITNPSAYKEGGYNILSGVFNIEAWRVSIHTDLKWYSRFGLLFILILCTFYEDTKKYWRELILGIVLIAPQVLIFGKSGMTERYIYPASIGFAYLFVYVPISSGVLKQTRKKIYIIGLMLLCFAHFRVMLREADYYRYRGNGVQATADFISNTVNQDNNVKVLSALEYFESNKTLEYYSIIHAEDNMYFYHSWNGESECVPYIDRRYDVYSSTNLTNDENRYDVADMDVIVMYSNEDRHFTDTPDIDVSDYEYKRYGTLDIFVKKSSGIDFPDANIKPLKINF